MEKLAIKVSEGSAIRITRTAVKSIRLVYVARANKRVRYPHGRSSIVYIGMTTRGARRISASAASKAQEILNEYGFKFLDFSVITCTGKPGMRSWEALERALIIKFREMYGDPPKYNRVFKNAKWRKEKQYFKDAALERVIIDMEEPLTR